MRAGRRAIRQGLRFRRARLTRARPLVKDPLALLSAEWLADRLQMVLAFLVRSRARPALMCSHDLVGAGVLRSARPHARACLVPPSG
jgi:hypothetical protein